MRRITLTILCMSYALVTYSATCGVPRNVIEALSQAGGGVYNIPEYVGDEELEVTIISHNGSYYNYSKAMYSYRASSNPDAGVLVNMPDTVWLIDYGAFQAIDGIREVNLSKNLRRIDDCAFADCGGLQKITIPDSVTSMGYCVFGGCGMLSEITLSKGCKTIPADTFFCCSKLKSIEIPEGVTEIGSCAFKLCTSIETITIPESVTNICNEAFSHCYALSKVTILGDDVLIGQEAFYHCTNLQEVVIKGNGVRLQSEVFRDCPRLKAIDTSRIKEVSWGAFVGCPIEIIALSSDVVLSGFAFGGCDKVTTIKIEYRESYSSGFTNMFFATQETSEYDFSYDMGDDIHISPTKLEVGFIPNIHNLSNVEELVIVDGATEGNERLYLPPNVKRVKIPASMTNLTGRLVRGGVKYNVDKNNQCYCSDANGSLFTKDKKKLLAYGNPNRQWHVIGFDGWSSVPPEEIGDGAFQNCNNVRWMTFPQGVMKIGAKAFKGCTGLESIWFEGPRITKDPFGPLMLGTGKTNVISLINGGPVKSIGESAFADCLNLRCELYFPDTLSTIGDMAFANCPKLSFARFYGAAPTVKDIYPERGVFHNSGAYGVSCEYRFDYTNKWAKAMQTYTIVDGHVVTNDNIIGYWQEAHCYPDHIESKPDEIIVYDGAYRLTLDANDGACAVSTLIVESGEKIDGMPDAMRDGYSFIGWFDALDGGTKVSTNTIIECDMTLYAHWTENPPPTPTYTDTTPVPVRHDWLAKYSGILTAAGNDYEAAAMRPTGKRDGKGNALCVWHDYVAGTDPTNLNSRFKAKVDLANGTPVVKWEPDLNEDGTKSERFYKVFGKKTLATNENWTRLADESDQKDYNFFKVTVNMEETPDTDEELQFGDGTGGGSGETGGGNVNDDGDGRPITLDAPYDLTAEGTGYGYIRLSWRSDISYSSDSSKWVDFCVYRANVNNISKAVKIATKSMNKTYIPKEHEDYVEDYNTYYYWVRAETETARSEFAASGGAAAKMPGPKNLTATNGRKDGILLAWDAVNMASSYKISADDGDCVRDLGETGGTTFFDADAPIGTFVSYKITTVGSCADAYSYSTVRGARWSGEYASPTVTLSSGSSSLYVYLTAIPGATGYKIYRSEENDISSAQQIGDGTWFWDSSAVQGRVYYYWAKAVYADGESDFSGVAIGGATPASPSNVQASQNRTDGIEVTWNMVEGAESYKVYGWRVGVDSDYVVLGTTTGTRWLDTTVSPGQESIYTVSAIAATGESYTGGRAGGIRTRQVVSVVMIGPDEATVGAGSLLFSCIATFADGSTATIVPDSWDASGFYAYEFYGHIYRIENGTLEIDLGNHSFNNNGTSQVTVKATYTANAGDENPTVYNLSHTVTIYPAE